VIPGQPPPVPSETPIDVYRAGGLDPAIALRIKADNEVFLGEGFLPVLASHPLHTAIFGSHPSPKWSFCMRPTRLAGHVVRAPVLDDMDVQIAHHAGPFPPEIIRNPMWIGIQATTAYSGTTRLGLPYIAPQSRLWVRGAFCDGSAHSFIASAIQTVP